MFMNTLTTNIALQIKAQLFISKDIIEGFRVMWAGYYRFTVMRKQVSPPRAFKGDLRLLTNTLAAVSAIFGVVVLGTIAWSGWSANREAAERERNLVENALDQSILRVLNEQKSIAWWDDAVKNIAIDGVNFEWVDINFGLYLSETYGHAEVYILDGAGQPVYAHREGASADPSAYLARATEFAPLIDEVRTGVRRFDRVRDQAFVASQAYYRDLLGARLARWGGHIMSVDGKPAVVTAITIVPNVEFDLIQGRPPMLISVVPIEEAFMADIGRSLMIPDLAVATSPPTDGDHVADAFIADDETPVGYLTWTPRKPGQSLLQIILPLVGLAVIGAVAMTGLMTRRLKSASEELASREARARFASKHDALSGLPNRHHFAEVLQERLDHLGRGLDGVAVAYIDVDRFKDVNDTLGHHAGDALIRAVARRLAANLGPDDFLARFGGDEFAIMRSPMGADGAQALGERLRAAFQESFDISGQAIRMTASIGIAAAPKHGVTPEDLMRHADIALYEGKKQGRDRAMVFCSEMALDVEQRREIELDLRDAIENDGLALHYQPVISCASNKISGVEALLRWRHPLKGDISPAIFVPIAEDSGLMPALGAWVLEQAVKDAARWPELQISINLSPVQFRHVDLEAHLTHLLATHAIDPSRIVLEVTEGVLLEGTDRNRNILEAIRRMGFKVALDDFGTGYSSLRYLSDFRFDKIKIDRAFVTGINERKRAMTIIQAVVTLGRGLGMDIVAEGVETEAEATVMKLVGVNELQGFYFSRAVPPDEIERLMTDIAGEGAAIKALAALPDLSLRRTGA